MSDDDHDFLDEIIEESTARNPDFPRLMIQARRSRELLSALGEERKRRRVPQKVVAAAMGTSQSAVSELEKTAVDAKVSTVERYADAIGLAVEYHLVPVNEAAEPAILVHDHSSLASGRRRKVTSP